MLTVGNDCYIITEDKTYNGLTYGKIVHGEITESKWVDSMYRIPNKNLQYLTYKVVFYRPNFGDELSNEYNWVDADRCYKTEKIAKKHLLEFNNYYKDSNEAGAEMITNRILTNVIHNQEQFNFIKDLIKKDKIVEISQYITVINNCRG